MNSKYEGFIRLGGVMACGLMAGALASAVYGESTARQVFTAVVVSVAAGLAMLVRLSMEASTRRREKRERASWSTRSIEPTPSRVDAA